MSIQQHLLTVHGRSSGFFQKNLKYTRRYIILSLGTICSCNTPDFNLDWHTAFRSAAEIELHADLDKLHFRGEYLLGKQPMRSDLLITCSHKNAQFHSNLAQIFRTYNFVEYKSPDDLMTVRSFYKVYSYACKFLADMPAEKKPDPEEITLTFICSHYPRKMLRHLRVFRKIQIHKRDSGVYDLTGDPFTMQLIVLPQLTKEKNFYDKLQRKIQEQYLAVQIEKQMSKNEIISFMHKEQAYVETAPRDIIQFKYAESLQI